MNPREITDIASLQEMVVQVLNSHEALRSELEATREQLSDALDEIKRLKGEKGRPHFGSKRKKKKASPLTKPPKSSFDPDSSSNSPSSPPSVDRIVEVDLKPVNAPSDLISKGCRSVYQKNILIKRDTVEYRISRWYSPSENQYYESELPPEYQGQTGSMLQSFIQILHHCGDMTHRKILELLTHLGIELSEGGISNLLTHSDWVLEEQSSLLESSIKHSPYVQIDSTMSKEKGQRHHTQILCGEFFSLFSTQPGRSRLDVYAALQGQSREEVTLAYTDLALDRLLEAKVSKKHLTYFQKTFSLGQILSVAELQDIFASEEIFAKTNQIRRSAIAGALAAGYYYQQDQIPIAQYLMSDDAREYKKVASEKQIHCWIHAIRHYRILNPSKDYLNKVHSEFMTQLWDFYESIKTYQELPRKKRLSKRKKITAEFDRLFGTQTDYTQLNEQMERTQKNRSYLLAFLDYHPFPLHNNAAERGARRVVRKRDISFHTWSERGTRMRDAFMSLHQTAKKLEISFLDYLLDRNSRRHSLDSLALQVQRAYEAGSSTF